MRLAIWLSVPLLVAGTVGAAIASPPAVKHCDVDAAYRRYAQRCFDQDEQYYRDAADIARESRRLKAEAKRGIVDEGAGGKAATSYVRRAGTRNMRRTFASESQRQEVIATADDNLKEAAALARRYGDTGRPWLAAALPPRPSLGDMGRIDGETVFVAAVERDRAEIVLNDRTYFYFGDTRQMRPKKNFPIQHSRAGAGRVVRDARRARTDHAQER
jgi:hypothetical protein